ncbi:hypothetical protein DFA_09150 [Cavenderia fasciculata]|uniref:Uncharacterized protein n=1 Tax=Cavenderia fasciculata TaxID=261658 RepID=F4Q6U3_CACFS|nr:uncharacterized protein DFA_09150 [Cavenderia fasciculata]EGG16603.1 hypothetical protein DFA_09150 [Cavenderia fasciculata]|eukprot:XP_004355003.1 hypothetical protein DFA_09150 [Cavenderia fasciculata]
MELIETDIDTETESITSATGTSSTSSSSSSVWNHYVKIVTETKKEDVESTKALRELGKKNKDGSYTLTMANCNRCDISYNISKGARTPLWFVLLALRDRSFRSR